MTGRDGIRQLRFVPPPGAAELLLVRHGESAPIRDGEAVPLLDGQSDPELDPRGHEQAERIAERLAGEPIAAIYVTTLRRTRETAAPLAVRTGLEPRVEADLREVHQGEWEGGEFRRRVVAGDPIVARLHAEQRWDVVPGAEPAKAFAARVRAAVGRIAAAHPDELVAVVSHGGTIGEILRQASASRGLAFAGADNGSISHLVVLGDEWTLRRYNDTGHLHPGFSAAVDPPA